MVFSREYGFYVSIIHFDEPGNNVTQDNIIEQPADTKESLAELSIILFIVI